MDNKVFYSEKKKFNNYNFLDLNDNFMEYTNKRDLKKIQIILTILQNI